MILAMWTVRHPYAHLYEGEDGQKDAYLILPGLCICSYRTSVNIYLVKGSFEISRLDGYLYPKGKGVAQIYSGKSRSWMSVEYRDLFESGIRHLFSEIQFFFARIEQEKREAVEEAAQREERQQAEFIRGVQEILAATDWVSWDRPKPG
jgi:hypothetical protein